MARPVPAIQTLTPWLILLVVMGIQSCAPSRWVEPLDKGQVAVSANLGGPLIILGDVPLFIPLSSVAAGYGLTDKLTLSGGIHTTAMAFGVIQTDLGAVYAPIAPRKFRPGLSGFAGINPMVDVWEGNFRCYPQLDVNAWWKFGSKGNHLVYAGCSGWGNFFSQLAYGRSNPNTIVPALQTGVQFRSLKWSYNGELKWIGMNRNPDRTVVDYVTPGMGALGLQFGLTRYFGGGNHE